MGRNLRTMTAIGTDDVREFGPFSDRLAVDHLGDVRNSAVPFLFDGDKGGAQLNLAAESLDVLPDNSLVLPLAENHCFALQYTFQRCQYRERALAGLVLPPEKRA